MKNKIECDYCLLGNGYASNVASYLLKKRGKQSTILGLGSSMKPYELQLGNDMISPLPIFPEKNSTLFEELELSTRFPEPKVDFSFSELGDFNISDHKIHRNSLADFLYKDESSLMSIILSIKQWGLSIFTDELAEVRNKISRNYISSNNVKVGYLEGLDLYYHFCFSSGLNPEVLNLKSIEKIDYKNKRIITDRGEIHYKKLISTIPIKYLLGYCGLEAPSSAFISYPSYFFYFRHTSPFPENKIFYDCDIRSSIFRFYSVTDNIIVAQISTFKKGEVTASEIIKRIKELVPSIESLTFEKELFFQMSYPVESISDPMVLGHIQELKQNSILPLGRFGNWEYKDLHELDWESMYKL